MIKIDTQPVVYFSQLDEDHFFTWAQEIDCITSIEMGYLHIDPEKINEATLRDVLALLERYKLSAKSLTALCNSKNEIWFKNPQAFWYQAVFGNA